MVHDLHQERGSLHQASKQTKLDGLRLVDGRSMCAYGWQSSPTASGSDFPGEEIIGFVLGYDRQATQNASRRRRVEER